MIQRLKSKWEHLLRYPRLGADPSSRRDLWMLSLWRNRMLGLSTARALTRARSASLTPALTAAGGNRIAITLGDWSALDCFDEIFISNVYRLDHVPFAPDLCVDCGAFCGYFAALACGFFPGTPLACFEPNPAHVPALRRQLDLLASPSELIQAAAWTEEGRRLFLGDGMGGHLANARHTDPGGIEVRTVDFPGWLQERQPRRLLLKMDVEGAEASLLPRILPLLPETTALFLETHHAETQTRALLDPYRLSGFEIREVRRRREHGRLYIEWELLRRT